MKKIPYLLCCASIMSACAGSGGTSSSTDETSAKSEAVSQCLAAKDYQYEALLTKADIAKYVNMDESSYNKKVSPTKGKYGSCTYSWDSDRPRIESEVMGRTIKRLDNNQVTIKMLDFYTDEDLERNQQESVIDLFDMGYKKLSQAEYDKSLANLEKKLGDKPKDLARAKKMLDSRMNFKYKTVDDLGDRAYWKWSDYGVELIVLIGNSRFTIESKTTGEPESSLEHAVKFTKEVLAKCDGQKL